MMEKMASHLTRSSPSFNRLHSKPLATVIPAVGRPRGLCHPMVVIKLQP